MHPGDTARFLGEQVNSMWEVSTMGCEKGREVQPTMHPDLWGCLLYPHELTITANIPYDGGRRKDMQS